MNGPPPAALDLPSARLDSRLAVRYRRLQLLIALPLFALILGLAASQYGGQRAAVQRDMAREAAGHVIALDSIVNSAFDHVAQMRVWAEGYLRQPPGGASALRQALAPRRRGAQVEGYAIEGLERPAREGVGQVLWLDGDPRRPGPRSLQVAHALAFFEMVKLTHAINPHFQWSYFFPVQRDYFSIYPWVASGALIEGMGHPDMPTAVHAWFGYEIYRAGTPEQNPQRQAYWTAPYLDSAGAGAMVSHGAPVYVRDQFQGIVGTDLKLVTLSSFLKGLPRAAGRLLIVDRQGMLLADSDSPLSDRLRTVAEVLPAGLRYEDLRKAQQQPGQPVDLRGYTLIARPASDAPWLLVSIVSDRDILRMLLPRFIPYLVIALALALAYWTSLVLLRRQFIQPALQLLQHVQRLSADPATPEPALPALWQTWSAMLTRTFADFRQAELVRSAIVHNAPIAVVTADRAGRVVEFNPAAEATFGHPRAAMLGQDIALLAPPRLRRGQRRRLALLAAGRLAPGRRMERTGLRADGEEFPLELALATTQVGERTLYTAFVLDLSERRRAEDELARQRESARQAEKLTAMGALLAGVAHELNNPLAILIGRASLLQDKAAEPALQKDAAAIRAAAERCGRIVSMFLAMARQRSVELRPVQLNDVVRSAVELFGYTLRASGIQVELALAAELPLIQADPDQLGQIVLNLVVNAQQSLSGWSGPRRLLLRTDWEGAGGQARLQVSDSGPGVPEAIRERIFDPFFTTKTDGTGTGMGLAVSRSIVRQHQGQLVLAADGPGACFVLTLPVQPGPPAGPEHGPGEDAAEPAGDRVLIVEDEAELAGTMEEMLARAGFLPDSAADGAAALAWLERHVPVAILCDVRMPGMDGPAFWRALGRRHPALCRRVLFVTGDTLGPGVADFLHSTGCPCLEKPFTAEELVAQVRRRAGQPA